MVTAPSGAAVDGDFTAAQRARAGAFHRRLRGIRLPGLAAGLALRLLLGLTPLGAALVTAVGSPIGGAWPAQLLLGLVAFGLLQTIVGTPTAVRAEVLLRRYGLSTQDWGGWLRDRAKAALVGGGLSAVGVIGWYAAARATPRWWVATVAVGAGLLTLLLAYAGPLVIEPLFHRFRPLPPGTVRTDLVQLAERAGLAVGDVLVADASRRTTGQNAYVSGLGGSRRLVVYDTVLSGAPTEEVRLVVAHELGHVRNRDLLWGAVAGALSAAVGAAVLAWLVSRPALLGIAGATGPTDPRSLGLLFALGAAGGLLAAPAYAFASRRVEARADRYALAVTGDPAGFVAMQRRLAVANLADLQPNRVLHLWFATHPSVPERIAAARRWPPGPPAATP